MLKREFHVGKFVLGGLLRRRFWRKLKMRKRTGFFIDRKTELALDFIRKKIKEQKMSYMQIDTFKKEWVRDASSKYGL